MTSKFPPKKQEQYIFKPAPKHDWSEYQKAVFRDIAKGEGHTLVIARAGSAKTSSLVEGARYVPKGKKALFCAFNKAIQEELRARLPSYIECLTLHSLGFRGIKLRFGNVEVDNDKCWKIVEELAGKDDYDLIANLCRTVHFCKHYLVDTPSKIDELIAENGIDLCDVEIGQFIRYVIQALRLCKERTTSVDFDDMVYLPFVYRINVGKFHYVFVDEAQDMSKAMIELALSAVAADGRVIAVGDPQQAIYSFMGADSHVFDNLRERLHPKELTLPICYRCPKKIVALAQTLVPDILPHDGSPEGEIIDVGVQDLLKLAKKGSCVLSRLNAPLIKLCMLFLKNNTPANIMGRDIGNGLQYLIKKSKKKTIKELLQWLVKWEEQEKENLRIKYPKASGEFISDRAECIRMLCEGASTIQEVKSNLDQLFQENERSKIVLFSSIHRYKGSEAHHVFVLMDTLRSSNEEELNLQYISFTRSKSVLYRVHRFYDKDITEQVNSA
jgi:superfamily I DNA/RNA helicase